ncbi:MAG: C40 family peptidase [Gammaproteobacteria bacterium]
MQRYGIAILLLMLGACASAPGPVTPSRISVPDGSSVAPAPGAGQEFALRALGFVGVPYRWGGTSPDGGFDCSGLIRYVYEQMTGRPLPYNAYGLARFASAIDDAELQPGDLVFFNTLRSPYSHVGIYLGESRFLHAPRRGSTVQIADMNNRYWTARYNGARRLPI